MYIFELRLITLTYNAIKSTGSVHAMVLTTISVSFVLCGFGGCGAYAFSWTAGRIRKGPAPVSSFVFHHCLQSSHLAPFLAQPRSPPVRYQRGGQQDGYWLIDIAPYICRACNNSNIVTFVSIINHHLRARFEPCTCEHSSVTNEMRQYGQHNIKLSGTTTSPQQHRRRQQNTIWVFIYSERRESRY